MVNTRKGRQNINTLLVVLIGFCVLAIIEIVYGQAQMKVERERLALEEQNNQTVEELKEEWRKLQEGSSVAVSQSETEAAGSDGEKENAPVKTTAQSGGENKDQAAAGEEASEKKDEDKEKDKDERGYSMQIVILGDSIMDGDRTESGAADIIGEQLNAKIYNMSMGGTTAALLPNEQYNFATWDSRCLMGVRSVKDL